MKKVVERKNDIRITVAIGLILVMGLVYAQATEIEFVSLKTIKKVALNNARSLWGDVYAADPIPYYGLDDEIIGYMFNFRKGRPFPDCRTLKSTIGESDPWGKVEYCHITVNARYSDDPIEEYAECLSEDLVLENEIEEMAKEALSTSSVELVKVYFIDPACKWYMFISGTDTIYVKHIPPSQVYSPAEFDEKVRKRYQAWRDEFQRTLDKSLHKIAPPDYRVDWDEYKTEKGILSTYWTYRYIPKRELMPFYDWHYGCGPTSAAMCLAYFDKRGIYGEYENYGRFISYHFYRHDHIQDGYDYQIPDIQQILADKMHTGPIYGETAPYFLVWGIEDAAKAKGHDCNAEGHGWGFNFDFSRNYMVNSIKADRPCIVGTWDHYMPVVGYKREERWWGVKYKMFVHNTWDGEEHCWNWPWDSHYNITTIKPKSSGIGTIELLWPLGDTRYNGNGDEGELLVGRRSYDIQWRTNNPGHGYVSIYYRSPDMQVPPGKLLIAENAPNTGTYSWVVPSTIPSTKDGRIDLVWKDPDGNPIAEDGSLGPFRVIGGGTLPGLSGLAHFYEVLPANYKFFLPRDHHWTVVGLNPGPGRGGFQVKLYSDTLFVHHQVTDEVPVTPTAEDKIGFVVCCSDHISSVPTWMGVRFELFSVDPTSYTAQCSYSTDELGLGRNDLVWLSGELVRVYDLPLPLSHFDARTDTIRIVLSCDYQDTSDVADMGIALYDRFTTYKWDNRQTAMDLHRYADEHGRGGNEIIELTRLNIFFTKDDTCGLVVFAKNISEHPYTFHIDVIAPEIPDYDSEIVLLPDSVFHVGVNPTILNFEKIANTYGVIGVKPTEKTSWSILVTENPAPDSVDTLATSSYGYPFTNFCVFDFTRLESLPDVKLERRIRGGGAAVQYDPGSGNLIIGTNGPFQWEAEDIIKIWTLDLRSSLLADSIVDYDYQFKIKLNVSGDAALTAGIILPAREEEEGEDICLGRGDIAGFLSEDSTLTFYGEPARYGIVVWSENEASAEFSIEIAQEGGMDVGVNAIDMPDRAQPGDSIFPEATVENYGPTTADFNVECTIEPGGYIDTKTVTGLEPGATQNVDFKVWVPEETGEYTVTVTTKLEDNNPDNNIKKKTISVTGIAETKVPSKFEFSCIRPTPFSLNTEIFYQLPFSSEVSLTIYDISGKLIRTFARAQHHKLGTYTLKWDGRNDNGRLLPSGIYFIRFKAGDYSKTQKVILFR